MTLEPKLLAALDDPYHLEDALYEAKSALRVALTLEPS